MTTKTKLNTFILLDRTGSMSGRWDEALSSINAYVDELAKDKSSSAVTVAVFDSQNGLQFDVIRDAVSAKKWPPLTNKDATPRGMTPLFDALGRIVSLAESADHKKTVIVVMTDGAENASREVTRDGAKSAIDRCQKRDWQVVFLGADFDAFGQSHQVGVAAGQTMTMDAGQYGAALRGVAQQSAQYASTGANVRFTDKDRKNASDK